MAAKKKQTFEDRLTQVEALIAEMESGALPLEDALKRYEEGMQALTALEKELLSAPSYCKTLSNHSVSQNRSYFF